MSAGLLFVPIIVGLFAALIATVLGYTGAGLVFLSLSAIGFAGLMLYAVSDWRAR